MRRERCKQKEMRKRREGNGRDREGGNRERFGKEGKGVEETRKVKGDAKESV